MLVMVGLDLDYFPSGLRVNDLGLGYFQSGLREMSLGCDGLVVGWTMEVMARMEFRHRSRLSRELQRLSSFPVSQSDEKSEAGVPETPVVETETAIRVVAGEWLMGEQRLGKCEWMKAPLVAQVVIPLEPGIGRLVHRIGHVVRHRVGLRWVVDISKRSELGNIQQRHKPPIDLGVCGLCRDATMGSRASQRCAASSSWVGSQTIFGKEIP